MALPTGLTVGLLSPSARRDRRLVDELTGLVNGVYLTAEQGLWRDGATRTTPLEVAELVAARQIAVATDRAGQIFGSIHIHQVADEASEFGMLVAAADRRGTGVGRDLVDFAERHSRSLGMRAIQLELLVPRNWRHPTKEFLRSWYGRIGYELIGTRRMDDTHPHLAPLLATPCDLEVREKPLATHAAASSRP